MIVGCAIIPSLLFMKVLQLMLKLSLPIIPICVAGRREWNGLSLSQVSGLGLCVVGSDIPTQYTHLCNRTISPDKDSSYLLPQNDTWWICLDGLSPCLATEAFSTDSSDFCVLVQLVPQLVYYPSEKIFHLWDQSHDSSLGLS